MSESTLPSLDDLGADDALLVHHKCHGFEAAWKSWHGGDPPVLEDWLVDVPSNNVRLVLLGELLQLELEYRRKAGEQPTLAEYQSRFSKDDALLRQVWSGTATGTLEPEEKNRLTDSELEILQPPREPGSLGSLEHYDVLDVVGRTPASRQDNQAAEPKGQQETTGWGDVEVPAAARPNLGDAVAPTRLGEAAAIAAGFHLTGHSRPSWPEPVPKASVCPICKAEVATEATVCGECGCSLRCEKSEDFATQGVAYRLYMHLQDTAVSIVTDLLHRTYTHQQGPPWAVAVNGEVIIYLDCYPIELMQFDDYAWLNLIDAMKALPAVTVIAHVMRRHTGHPQVVLEVLKKVLSEFRGVAQDQSGCCWTPERPVPSHDADRSLTPASGEDAQTTEPRKQQEETTGWGYVEVGAEKPAVVQKGERVAGLPKRPWWKFC